MSDRLLQVLIEAALEAGLAANRIYKGAFAVQTKADDSPVTAADQAAEDIILRHLARHAPHIAVVAEEQCAAGVVPVVGQEFFLVDPLDGTKEFVHRRGEFTVNIALIRDAVPTLGVVYAPATGQLYVGDVAAASAGRASLDPDDPHVAPLQPIQVRAIPAAGLTAVASRSHRTRADGCLPGALLGGASGGGGFFPEILSARGRARRTCIRAWGPTMEWDTAAGHAVLVAAGGRVVGPDAQPLRYGKPQFRNSWFVASGPFVPYAFAA